MAVDWIEHCIRIGSTKAVPNPKEILEILNVWLEHFVAQRFHSLTPLKCR
jgi:hypothetical protein